MRPACLLLLLSVAAFPEEAPEIDTAIARLGHKEAAVRAQAAAELERAGRDAVAPLKAALEKATDPEVRVRIEALLDKLDWPDAGPAHEGLRLTLRLQATDVKPGGAVEGKVRLSSEAKKARTLDLLTEAPQAQDALARAVRLVIVDAQGHHRAIGEFMNLNRGPDRLTLEVAPGSVATAPVRTFAGTHLVKGNDTTQLEPGAYRVYAVLGDALGGWDRREPPPLRSNEVKVRVVAPDPPAKD